jgi:hypothetical protein
LRIVQTPFFRASTAGQSFFLQFRAERAVQNNNFFRPEAFYFANCNHKIFPEIKLLFNTKSPSLANFVGFVIGFLNVFSYTPAEPLPCRLVIF